MSKKFVRSVKNPALELKRRKKVSQRFKWLVDLSFLQKQNKNFDGTIIEFEKKILDKPKNGNFRSYFQYLISKGIVKVNSFVIIRGKKYPKYKIDKEKLIDEIESWVIVSLVLKYIWKISPNVTIISSSVSSFLESKKEQM